MIAGVGAAPLGGAGAMGLAGLAAVLAACVLLGAQKAWKASAGALLRTVADALDVVSFRGIHLLGSLSSWVRKQDKRVESWLGKAALASMDFATYMFQQAWNTILWTVREIADLAVTVEQAIWTHKFTIAKALITPLRLFVDAQLRLVRKAIAVARDQTESLFGRAHKGIDYLTKQTSKAIPKQVGRVAARVGRLEKTLASPRWWRTHWETILTPAIAASIVATAFGRLGLRWLRCGNVKRTGRWLCGIPSDALAFLFDAATLAFLVTDICKLVTAMQAVAEKVEPVLFAFVNEIQGYVCGGHQSAPSGIVAADWEAVSRLPSGLTAAERAAAG